MNFRLIMFFVIFCSGAVSLTYQVIWQKYISILFGSDSLSNALLVSIFLLGLSSGYIYFGKKSVSYKSRKEFLTFYGVIEFLTGLYAMLFPYWFKLFDEHLFSLSQNLFGQIFVCIALLFIPTFLMGATIPVMTSVVPENSKSINKDHAIIYGTNTIGAFAGVIVGTFFIIPNFGLEFGMTISGLFNIIISVPYLANELKGNIEKQDFVQSYDETPSTKYLKENQWPILAIAFLSGMVSLSLENFWFRIWALTIGSSYLVFPMVLGVFVLSLGLGSLTLKQNGSSIQILKTLVYSITALIITYTLVPYLPLWISTIRVMLRTLPINYYIYNFASFTFLFLILFPSLFFLGRLLPLAYGLLNKDGKNYGQKCSYLYFLNTIGTFIGSLFIGHLLLHFFNIDRLYQFTISSLIFFTIIFAIKTKTKITKSMIPLLSIFILLLLPWSRNYHHASTFRDRAPKSYHFKSLFEIAKNDSLFYKDGPNASVGISSYHDGQDLSVFVNGKSDSATKGDFRTVSLVSLLPYVYSQKNQLNSLVIGLGTGISAGQLSVYKHSKNVDAVEISQAVIEAQETLKKFNYDLLRNEKIKIFNVDAFNFLKKRKVKEVNNKYDIIISEPTNPWVNGVENLFTSYFYDLVKSQLNENGILSQWIHTYSMDNSTLITILKSIREKFKYVKIFSSQSGDLVIIASDQLKQLHKQSLEIDDMANQVLKELHIRNLHELLNNLVMNEIELDYALKTNPDYHHSIFFPAMSKYVHYSFYTGQSANLNTLIDPFVARALPISEEYKWRKSHLDNESIIKLVSEEVCNNKLVTSLHCNSFEIHFYLDRYMKTNITNIELAEQKLIQYSFLRKKHIIEEDDLLDIFNIIRNKNIAHSSKLKKLSQAYVNELIKDQNYDQLKRVTEFFIENGYINQEEIELLKRNIVNWQNIQLKAKKIIDQH